MVFSHAPHYPEEKKKGKGSEQQDDEVDNRFYGRPALYFYDVDHGKETHRLKGGEALISYNDYKNTDYKGDRSDKEGELGRLMFLGNAMMMKEKMWSDSYKIKKQEDVAKTEVSDAAKFE